MIKVKPNEPCPCGAKKKYKKCCYAGQPIYQLSEALESRLKRYSLASRVFSVRFYKMHQHLLPKTEVRASSIHGNGVFALEDIPKFTPVAIYPLDYCCFQVGTTTEVRLRTRKDVPMYNQNEEVIDRYRISLTTNLENTALERMRISYAADPTKRDYGNAHLLNDAGCMEEDTLKAWDAYMHTFRDTNVIEYHIGTFGLFFVAIRDIKAGDELLYHYGMGYWTKTAERAVKLAAEDPGMAKAEMLLKDTWRNNVAEKLTQLTQLDKSYRQHDFKRVYDQLS